MDNICECRKRRRAINKMLSSIASGNFVYEKLNDANKELLELSLKRSFGIECLNIACLKNEKE